MPMFAAPCRPGYRLFTGRPALEMKKGGTHAPFSSLAAGLVDAAYYSGLSGFLLGPSHAVNRLYLIVR
jgi:hypothetical protein